MIHILKKIWTFSGNKKPVLGRAFIFSFLLSVFQMLDIAALYYVLTALITGDHSAGIVWRTFLILSVGVIGRYFCSYRTGIDMTEAGYFMCAQKRIHIGDLLKSVPLGYFNQKSMGHITAVVTTIMNDIENIAPHALILTFGGMIQSFVIGVGMLIFDWRIGLIMVAGIFAYILVTEWQRLQTKKASPQRQQAQAFLVKAVLEYLQGISVIKSFLVKDGSGRVKNGIEESAEKNLRLELKTIPGMIVSQSILKIFSVLIQVAALVLFFRGDMKLVHCLLMLIASFLVFAPLDSAGYMLAMLNLLDVSLDEVNQTDATPRMDIGGETLTPSHYNIDFEEVCFAYDDKETLHDINARIQEGCLTAIVGPSGSGKSTFCHLISRFWDVDSGAIFLGGRDVRDYTLDSLLSNISMVFQNVYLFRDTILNNIRFGKPEATLEEVRAVARAARCDDFIMSLPKEYDTMVGEGGRTLSGGEKQRISIARAMLKDAPIIILDEATSSVDPENEVELLGAIEALTNNKTVIMIAHRMKTVRHAKKIIVLDDGQIVQQGTHGDLIFISGIYHDFMRERTKAAGWTIQQ